MTSNDDSAGGSDAATPARWNFNTGFGLAAIAFGIVLFIITPFEVERPRLLFGQKPSGLDSDFFPRFVAVLLILTGGWLTWASFKLREDNGILGLDREAVTNVVVTVVAFFALAVVMPKLGFVISAVLMLGALSTYYGNRSILYGLTISIGVPLVFYNILRVWLLVVLPQQPFFEFVLWI